MSLVEFKNVYKRYTMGEVTINAVDGISFDINEGEFAVVVGASGAGKNYGAQHTRRYGQLLRGTGDCRRQ